MLRNVVCALPLFGVACSFSTELPGEDETGPDGAITPTAMRCQSTGMALCIDFEDMPSPKDGILPEATITATNVVPKERLTEFAAELAPGSQLRVGDTAKLDITQTLTVEMWTKPMSIPLNLGDKQAGLFDTHLQYQMNFEADQQVECRIEGGGEDDNVDSGKALTIGAWHHVACTYDGTVLKVYVNGRLEGCQPTTRTVTTQGTFGAAIGANMDVGPAYKNLFIGQLDNVHVYASTLSASQICGLWGNGNCSDQCPESNGGNGGGFGGWDD